MLIGMGNRKTPDAPSPDASASAFIFDATAADFETKIVHASMTTPVLVDFWAPWCGPCKQLTPVLEQLVNEVGGKVLLAKINIDDNPELAQALRIQSVPTVFAFFQGQPVTAFTGARPASELKTLIAQLSGLGGQGQPEALDIPAVLAQAAAFLSENKLDEAQSLYLAVLERDELNVQAFSGLARTLIAANALDQARVMIDDAPDAMKADSGFAAIRAALDLAEKRPDDATLRRLEQAVASDENGHAARFDLAVARFAMGDAEAAIDHLIEIVRRNKAWEDEKARIQLLQFFEALGPSDPQTMAGRRKLSSVLFS